MALVLSLGVGIEPTPTDGPDFNYSKGGWFAPLGARDAIRVVARPSRAPLPYPASVTRGPGRPPPLRFAPAVVVGGKGEWWPALWGGAFLSATAWGAFMRAGRKAPAFGGGVAP